MTMSKRADIEEACAGLSVQQRQKVWRFGWQEPYSLSAGKMRLARHVEHVNRHEQLKIHRNVGRT